MMTAIAVGVVAVLTAVGAAYTSVMVRELRHHYPEDDQ